MAERLCCMDITSNFSLQEQDVMAPQVSTGSLRMHVKGSSALLENSNLLCSETTESLENHHFVLTGP